jgi:DNA-binding IclR family transcriptional regulator
MPVKTGLEGREMATKTNSGGTETGVQVIARAGEILRLLAQSEQGTSLRMLAVATGLPRSTVHRIVVALASEHLVVWDPERGVADLGLGLVSLALARRQRLRDAVRPHLESLVRRTNETADLAVLRGGTAVIVDQVMAHRLLVVSAIGAPLPVHATACGKALLAGLRPEEAEHVLPQKLKSYTPNTITDRSVLLEQIAEVRATGLAWDHDEHTMGVSGVAGMIHDAWGETAVITIPVPSLRFGGREPELGHALRTTCERFSGAAAG